jgi:hypothetical protein
VNIECFEVDNGQLKQCRVSFSIVDRRAIGRVVEISYVGSKALDKGVAEKYGILACVNKLATIGYNLPTYYSLNIQSIDAGSYHDLKGFCARLAQHNQNDVVSLSPTLAASRFVIIEKLGSHIHFFCQHLITG